MGLIVIDEGVNNVLDIAADCRDACNGYIKLTGSNNHIQIETGATAYDFAIDVGNNCKIKIGKRVLLARTKIFAKDNSNITIGEYTGFTNRAALHAGESFDISIGSNCAIADKMMATVSDMHSIVDLETGRRLNHGRSIIIEDNVWLGAQVTIMKGSFIGTGSIIGIGSIVTGKIPQNCVASGAPASVKKTNVTWDYRLL